MPERLAHSAMDCVSVGRFTTRRSLREYGGVLEFAAVAATVLLGGMAIFQLLLASGVALGRFAWGGRYAVLPARLRVGSAVSLAVYAVAAVAALGHAGVLDGAGGTWAHVVVWGFAVFAAASVPLNALSSSRSEAVVMAPLSAVLAALFLLVAVL